MLLPRVWVTGSRNGLALLCQVLWAKTPEQALEGDRGDMNAILPQLPEALSTEQVIRDVDPARTASSVPQTPGKERESSHEHKLESGIDLRFRHGGLEPRAGAIVPTGRPERRPESTLNLTAQLPVTKLRMRLAWQRYRRMKRVDRKVELDVAGTIEQLTREGVVVEPAQAPHRTNVVRVLILIDEGGSMVPFRYLTSALIESARDSGSSEIRVFYFHDEPGEPLFKEASLLEALTFEEAAGPVAGAGTLIVSDAGAARGNLDLPRVRRTVMALRQLRRLTPNVAWLNPMPVARWSGTTAEAIRGDEVVPMFPYDRDGLIAAIDVLRGRTNRWLRRSTD